MTFDLDSNSRRDIWTHLTNVLENFYQNTDDQKASIYPERKDVLDALVPDFDQPQTAKDAIDHVMEGLSKYAVHTPHPQYYGMFNPRPNFPSITADLITAVLNPQLAAWGHAPYAVEVEHFLVREIGKKFGYHADEVDGVFATGGAEAHLTGILCALNHKFPNYANKGIHGLERPPVIYCSAASHHVTIKAARTVGLGAESVKYISVDDQQKMLVSELEQEIEKDILDGKQPFLIMATMGTTGAGAIDPIDALHRLAGKHDMWLHADAAYGGAVVLSGEYRHLMNGIEKADSITFDAHKWLSVPMATSMFLTRHQYVLGKAFSICASYMPQEEDEIDRLGSYTHSIQWSRRFIGLKLYMSLLVFGWKGYDDTIKHHIRMGDLLREKLINSGWTLYNSTKLPIVCFNDPRFSDEPEFGKYMYESFLETGEAWIINYPVGDKYTIRACITNYATTEKHLDELVLLLNKKRALFS